MSNMFHKPIKKELAALVESKKPKRRLHSSPHPHATPASNSNGLSNDSTSIPNSTLKPTSSTPKPGRTPTRPDSDEEEYIPSSSFTDFRIVSAPKQLWKYNVMKFAESKDKEVDLGVWRQPVKLNRKEYRPAERGLGSGSASSSGNVVGMGNGNESGGEDVKKTPMLGPDGKPVIGPDGRIVMVGPDGKVSSSIVSGTNAVAGSSKSNGGGGKTNTPNGKTKTKQGPRKKIKQVFLVPEEVRKLRREERYPWIFEEAPLDVKPSDTAVSSLGADANATPSVSSIPGQIWVGHLENPEKSQTHGLLVPKGSTFQFVPSYRYYKFTKKRSDVPGAEEAEAEYAKLQKSKDPTQLWKRRKGALSEATMKTLKSEPHSHSQFSVKYEDGDDFDDSSRRLRTVDAGGDDLFGGGAGDGDGRDNDEYDEEKMMRKRRNRELGQDGDLDEMEYEEEFADDDEKIEMDGDDEEMREMEERLKREYRNANKARDATIDEDEEDEEMEEMSRLTGAGKDLKKLVKRTEKNEAYESDDDEGNPYASEEEEEEQPPQPILDGPAVMNQQQPATTTPASTTSSGAARPASIPAISTLASAATTVSTPKQLPHVLSTYTPKPPSPSTASRPGSPLSTGGLAPPGMGNAIVAKRATSPKVGKTRTVGGNSNSGGSNSALTSGGARSPSPSPLGAGNRARTPTKSPMTSRAASPVAPVPPTLATTSLKRKAPDESQAPASPVSPISVADPISAGVSSSTNKPPRKKTKRPPPGPLDESLIINFLREKKDATTKDCIQRFQPYLREEETKKTFTAMVKKVAVVKKDILVLRDEYIWVNIPPPLAGSLGQPEKLALSCSSKSYLSVGCTMESSNHPLTLKVMRVSPFFTTSAAFSVHATESLVSLQGAEPLSGHPKTLRDLSYGLELLSLPATFGAIQLGETFTSCLCVNNEAKTDIQIVSVRIEIQTATNKLVLRDIDTGDILHAGGLLETTATHEMKELGQHVLCCSVSYRLSPVSEVQTLRKYYKFMVTNPLSVRTKVHTPHSPSALQSRSERDKIFLEVHIENLTQEPMSFELLRFLPVGDWNVLDGEPISSKDGLFLGTIVMLQPKDVRQYIFTLVPAVTSLLPLTYGPGSVIPLGRLDLSWRSSMGEPGRLLTSVLTRRIPPSITSPPTAIPSHLQHRPLSPLSRSSSPLPSSGSPLPFKARPLSQQNNNNIRSQSPGPTPVVPSTVDLEAGLVANCPPHSQIKVGEPFHIEFQLTLSGLLPARGRKRLIQLAVQHVTSSSPPKQLPIDHSHNNTPPSSPFSRLSLDSLNKAPTIRSHQEPDDVNQASPIRGSINTVFSEPPEQIMREHRRLPLPISPVSAPSNLIPLGNSIVWLSQLQLVHKEEAIEGPETENQYKDHVQTQFRYQFVPMRTGFGIVGSFRLLLIEDRIVDDGKTNENVPSVTLGNNVVKQLKEWDIISDIWVTR
ncbi:hypothetical protein Clacol_006753 [Clathrus columnatus]|uniref:Transcription initiation factor IIF subunit alpha n=1 Tax=Clathrus columnatus TaxID=1419009 RepID=A0AAV5ADQ7_9AGAM|nr:hypothetical protein Clacol_006753 [Clathrus columnatus]